MSSRLLRACACCVYRISTLYDFLFVGYLQKRGGVPRGKVELVILIESSIVLTVRLRILDSATSRIHPTAPRACISSNRHRGQSFASSTSCRLGEFGESEHSWRSHDDVVRGRPRGRSGATARRAGPMMTTGRSSMRRRRRGWREGDSF
jgi:hypothetical protein